MSLVRGPGCKAACLVANDAQEKVQTTQKTKLNGSKGRERGTRRTRGFATAITRAVLKRGAGLAGQARFSIKARRRGDDSPMGKNSWGRGD